MRADPLLMESFACEMDAAVYHSSLVGTTTFQQRAVTHQMLRAAASHTLATCVRARRTAELRKDAKAQAEATAKLAQHQALYQAMEAAELHPSWRTRTRAASRAEVEEAEEAARVQAEAALALGSADGGVHGCVLAQAATNDDGDWVRHFCPEILSCPFHRQISFRHRVFTLHALEVQVQLLNIIRANN